MSASATEKCAMEAPTAALCCRSAASCSATCRFCSSICLFSSSIICCCSTREGAAPGAAGSAGRSAAPPFPSAHIRLGRSSMATVASSKMVSSSGS